MDHEIGEVRSRRVSLQNHATRINLEVQRLKRIASQAYVNAQQCRRNLRAAEAIEAHAMQNLRHARTMAFGLESELDPNRSDQSIPAIEQMKEIERKHRSLADELAWCVKIVLLDKIGKLRTREREHREKGNRRLAAAVKWCVRALQERPADA